VALNWINEQPAQFYDQLVAANDPALPALDAALDIIETQPNSPEARPRHLTAAAVARRRPS
jgi:hypothetical protein